MKSYQYISYNQITSNFNEIQICDHMNGFSKNYTNTILDRIKDYNITVWSQYIFTEQIKLNYPNLTLKFDLSLPESTALAPTSLQNCTKLKTHKSFSNFVCSFNGSDHISRQFLISALYKVGWFNTEYNSKNFSTFCDRIDGNISSFFNDNQQSRFYRKFIINESKSAEEFYKSIIGFNYVADDQEHNINTLIDKINSSFVQIVSETKGDSYYPFISEKFVYPIIAKSLWVAYAQPGYHKYLATYYGFKQYNKLFNYNFDAIQNPVKRLVELLSMLSKFSKLTKLEWHDLYSMEQDTIQYNYDHYVSGDYLTQLQLFLE